MVSRGTGPGPQNPLRMILVGKIKCKQGMGLEQRFGVPGTGDVWYSGCQAPGMSGTLGTRHPPCQAPQSQSPCRIEPRSSCLALLLPPIRTC